MPVLIQDIISIATGALVVIIGILVQRAIRNYDKKVDANRASAIADNQAREERLTRMERTLNRHTRSLSALSRANKLAVETITQHATDLEELEDVTEQLQTAVDVNQRRLAESAHLINELREQRHRRAD